MADADNTVDPNDLDSIDALLDEVKLETVENDEAEISADAGGSDQVAEESQETDELLSDLESDLAEAEPEPEVPEPEPEPMVEPVVPKPEPMISDPKPQPQVLEDSALSFIEKRAANKQANNELTVAEMDAIKRLIIIFSSVLIVLGLVGIGIGVWAAVSAGSGLDEETKSQLENIEAGTTQSLMKTNTTAKTAKSLEKKLDALSFHIEQLNADIVKLENQTMANGGSAPVVPVAPAKQPVKPAPAAANPPAAKPAPVQVMPVATQPMPAAQPVMAKADPQMALKLDKVSSQISSAQRRIMEVNKRVKSLQGQYKKLLRGMKKVEKQMVEVKVSKAPEKTAEKDKKSSQPKGATYQYSAPEEMYYDHRNVGSYP